MRLYCAPVITHLPHLRVNGRSVIMSVIADDGSLGVRVGFPLLLYTQHIHTMTR